MAITLTSGYTWASGAVITPTRLNQTGTIVLAAAADTLVGATATGTCTEISCTAAGRSLIAANGSQAQRTVMNLGTISTQNATAVAIEGGVVVVPYYAATPSTLTYAATTTVDFSTASATMQTLTLTGNVTLATSNLAAGRCKVLRIVGDGSERTLTFPAWKFMGTAPTVIAASKTARMNLESWGTADASVVAVYSVEA